ncbi:MAG: pseudouridine synthase [Gammaproteobacteria bacterium]|nr:MAG: pseudouridine synthase [Gammaproteobacteria bacterium]
MRVRLNKFLADAGICARRKADKLIEEGRVKVNGQPAKIGMTVDPQKDIVEVDGKVVKPQRKRYLIFNKPCCVLTQLGKDPRGRKTLDEFLKKIPERVFPVGRLDYNTTGLLILTNDGELAQRILHPRYKLPKVYLALVEGRVHPKTLKEMKKGTELEDGFAKPDDIRIVRYEGDDTRLEIVFHEGRKHIVKRFLAKFGHRVKQLHRTQIGPVKLGKLPPGKIREMSIVELNQLKHAVGLK